MPPRHDKQGHPPDWKKMEAAPEFAALLARKRRFIIPATVFFIVYYFALPVLVGYFPELMRRRVFGAVNIAYLFALSQFVMAWTLAFFYLRASNRFDEMATGIRRSAGRS